MSRPVPSLVGAVLSAAVLLAATLVVTSPATSAADDPGAACATASGSGPVPTCTRLRRQGLVLPDGGAASPLGAVVRGGDAFVTSSGRRLPMSRDVVDTVTVDQAYAATVYRATVTDGRVSAVGPWLRVSEDALMTWALGGRTFTGRISERVGGTRAAPEYASATRLPVVLRLARSAVDGRLAGRVLNARRAVTVDGRCVEALPRGAGRPLGVGGFGAAFHLERHPAMHGPFDDEMVLAWNADSSGMGPGAYVSVATLLGHDRPARTWRVSQHGNPVSGPALTLRSTSAARVGCR